MKKIVNIVLGGKPKIIIPNMPTSFQTIPEEHGLYCGCCDTINVNNKEIISETITLKPQQHGQN